MLNSQFELSKIEREKTRVSVSNSRKSRVEREMENINRERNFSVYSRFFSRERDSCQCLLHSMVVMLEEDTINDMI